MLDTLKNTITEYPVSGAEAPQGLSHVKIFGRKVFFTDQGVSANYLGEVDPSTNTVSEWVVPTANAATGDLDVLETECNGEEGALIEFSEFQGGKVASLNTSLPSARFLGGRDPDCDVGNSCRHYGRSRDPFADSGRHQSQPRSLPPSPEWRPEALSSMPCPLLKAAPAGLLCLGTMLLIFTERSGNKVGILLH